MTELFTDSIFRVLRLIRRSTILLFLLFFACGREDREQIPLQPPRIVFNRTEHDFGRVEQGTRVRHVYGFANQGGQDLSVYRLRTGCGCSARWSGNGIVPPGGYGTIEVELDTGDDFGLQRRTVTVYSNDPENLATSLLLVGEISFAVAADPAQLYLGQLHPGEKLWREVTVVTAQDVEIVNVRTSGSRIGVVSDRLTDERSGSRLRVSIASDASPGPINESIFIDTNSARKPVLTIPVVGTVEDPNPEPRTLTPEP